LRKASQPLVSGKKGSMGAELCSRLTVTQRQIVPSSDLSETALSLDEWKQLEAIDRDFIRAYFVRLG
jgi:hypothetical protein